MTLCGLRKHATLHVWRTFNSAGNIAYAIRTLYITRCVTADCRAQNPLSPSVVLWDSSVERFGAHVINGIATESRRHATACNKARRWRRLWWYLYRWDTATMFSKCLARVACVYCIHSYVDLMSIASDICIHNTYILSGHGVASHRRVATACVLLLKIYCSTRDGCLVYTLSYALVYAFGHNVVFATNSGLKRHGYTNYSTVYNTQAALRTPVHTTMLRTATRAPV